MINTLIALGVGFCAFVIGSLCVKPPRLKKALYVLALIILIIACWQVTLVLWGFPGLGRSILQLVILALLCWLFVSALAWAARKSSAKIWILVGILILVGLFLPTPVTEGMPLERLWLPFAALVAIMPALIPSIALIIAALLLHSGLNLYQEWRNPGGVEGAEPQILRDRPGRTMAVVFVLSALLLAKTLDKLYWLTVWDNTFDPLGYLWLIIPVLAALVSCLVLTITLPGRAKAAGILYLVFTSALMIAVSARAQSVDFRQLTEERAERVTRAIESYHSKEGHYPQDLRQLIPWHILSLPEPVIIYGQDWCYDGGEDYYRLGYIYRQHWSDPRLIGQIYTTQGDMPDLGRMCEEQVVAMQERDPDYPYEYWMESE